MSHEELKQLVFDTAADLARKGPGWAQESMVLREVARRLEPQFGSDLTAQQAILTAWHDLFFEKRLSWGYNLDNPNSPFFHVPGDQVPSAGQASLTPAGKA